MPIFALEFHFGVGGHGQKRRKMEGEKVKAFRAIPEAKCMVLNNSDGVEVISELEVELRQLVRA